VNLRDNVVEVGKRVVLAARRAGRNPDAITVMGVSKTFPAAALVEAYDAGVRVFGENRVQEFAEKHALVRELTGADFHLIGHLQSNKAAKAAELFHAVDSVDSLKLAEKLNAAAGKLGKVLRVLIEINVGGEDAKSGLAPDTHELEELLQTAPGWRHLAIRGLMTIPPFTEDPEGARPYFRKLRELRDRIAARNLPGVHMDVLSMGMSHDFEVAIEEGSTCVRVGTAIFGSRKEQ
jgi:pyridoxal phosphate enzyme (YggS family)